MFSNAFSYIYAELSTGNIVNVPLDMLETKSFREKTDDDHLSALNLSMSEEGVLENILIMADEKNEKFLILEGNYRVEALRHLEEETVPAKLLEKHPYLSTLRAKAHRMDHSAIEIATLCQKALNEGYKQTELAAEFGIAKSTVSELVKFTLLPDHIKEAAHKDSKKFNHDVLRKLVKLEGDEQEKAFTAILNKEGKVTPARFSSFLKQLDPKKLEKKQLTLEDRDTLQEIMETISNVLANKKLHASSQLDEFSVTSGIDSAKSSTEQAFAETIVDQPDTVCAEAGLVSEMQCDVPMQMNHQIKDVA